MVENLLRLERYLSRRNDDRGDAVLIERFDAMEWFERSKRGRLKFPHAFEFTAELDEDVFDVFHGYEHLWLAYVELKLNERCREGYSVHCVMRSQSPVIDSGPMGRTGSPSHYDAHIEHSLLVVFVKKGGALKKTA